MKKSSLFSVVQRFFLVHLRSTKGLSENSIRSYRDTLRLFFSYVAKVKKKKIHRLGFDDFSSEIVLSFLASTEIERKNKIKTRNHRLFLLRMFFSYLLSHDEERAGVYEKILQISTKGGEVNQAIECLEPREIDAILNAIDRSSPKGLRDHTLLFLMYNTGARVQEICDLRHGSFELDDGPRVILVGKGRKSRTVPLWEKTRAILRAYLAEKFIAGEQALFYNPQGNPLTRHGVADILRRRAAAAEKSCPSLKKKRVTPHVIRHTTATHLLQSGVDLSVIRMWLGHVDINTTSKYVEIDMRMKQNALSKKNPPQLRRELRTILDKNSDVVSWLKNME